MRFPDTQLKGIDQTVSRVGRQVDPLREYRARLILNAATGKLGVRAAAGLAALNSLATEAERDDLLVTAGAMPTVDIHREPTEGAG